MSGEIGERRVEEASEEAMGLLRSRAEMGRALAIARVCVGVRRRRGEVRQAMKWRVVVVLKGGDDDYICVGRTTTGRCSAATAAYSKVSNSQ